MGGFVDRWVARLSGKGEPVTPDTYSEWQREYDAELKAARADTPALPKVKLPSYSDAKGCPKCGSKGLTTEHHAGVHADCPHLYMSDPKSPYEMLFYGSPAPRVVVARERQREAAVEHLDRRCCNCSYGWAEAVIATTPRKPRRSMTPQTPGRS